MVVVLVLKRGRLLSLKLCLIEVATAVTLEVEAAWCLAFLERMIELISALIWVPIPLGSYSDLFTWHCPWGLPSYNILFDYEIALQIVLVGRGHMHLALQEGV